MPTVSEDLSDHVFRQITCFLDTDKSQKIIIGYSGGLDSTVLLHVLVGLADIHESIIVQPVHVNHGVSQYSADWVEHCKLFCKQLRLSLTVCDFSLKEISSNREATYRKMRYEAFASHLEESDLLLTAHHQRDQAETVLFNLFRGGGISGLRGMKLSKEFANGYHLRPLLSISPESLAEYARHYKLSWIEDPSNQDLTLDRNYIRHKVLPLVQDRWPSALNSVFRTTESLAQSEILLDDLAGQDLANAITDRFHGVIDGLYLSVLDLSVVSKLSNERQINLLRHWIKLTGSMSVSGAQLDEIYQNLCLKPDASGLFELNNIQLRIYDGYLYLMEKLPHSLENECKVCSDQKAVYFEELGIKLEIDVKQGRNNLLFKRRKGGETIRKNNQSKSLKTIYQQQSIPPWERNLIPLIYINDVLDAVPGVIHADDSMIGDCRLSKYIRQNV